MATHHQSCCCGAALPCGFTLGSQITVSYAFAVNVYWGFEYTYLEATTTMSLTNVIADQITGITVMEFTGTVNYTESVYDIQAGQFISSSSYSDSGQIDLVDDGNGPIIWNIEVYNTYENGFEGDCNGVSNTGWENTDQGAYNFPPDGESSISGTVV